MCDPQGRIFVSPMYECVSFSATQHPEMLELALVQACDNACREYLDITSTYRTVLPVYSMKVCWPSLCVLLSFGKLVGLNCWLVLREFVPFYSSSRRFSFFRTVYSLLLAVSQVLWMSCQNPSFFLFCLAFWVHDFLAMHFP